MQTKMIFKMVTLVLTTTVIVLGCNKNKSATNTAEGEADMSPMDELKSVQTDLQAQLDAIVEPINSVDGIIEEFNSLAAEAQMDAEFSAMATASLEGGEVTVSAELSANVELKAKVDAFLAKVSEVGASLKATPDKATALLTACVEATAKVPALSAKVTASANAKAANILNKEKAAEGKAELEALAGVQADINAGIETVKSQATELPAQGAAAMAKLTAAFSGSAATSAG